jgi:hypothetical protein
MASMSLEAKTILSASVLASVLWLAGCARQEVAGTPAGCPGPDGPETVVCRFYQKVQQMRPSGLPSREEQRDLAPYLTVELQRSMDDARSYQEEFASEHPDEKPPFVDGSLFTSLFEGSTAFRCRGRRRWRTETWR